MIIVISGVAGSGKSTIGKLLSDKTGWDFIEGDDYHSESSKIKMSKGIPLTDEDRIPWLRHLNNIILSHTNNNKPLILACSALTEKYRNILLHSISNPHLFWLEGDFDLVKSRIEGRTNHFFSSKLLQSQFELAEQPINSIHVNIKMPPQVIVSSILSELSHKSHI